MGKKKKFLPETPLVDDLLWEIIRRNKEYQDDYAKWIDDPEWRKQSNLPPNVARSQEEGSYCIKWGLSSMENPSIPWDQCFLDWPTGESATRFFSAKKFRTSPTSGGWNWRERAAALRRDGKAWSEAEQEAGAGRYLWLRIDPSANLEEINHNIKGHVKDFRRFFNKETKNQIQDRIKNLVLVDKIEKENPLPTHRTFTKHFPPGNPSDQTRRTKMRSYAFGKILIENPMENPLRKISDEEKNRYLTDNGFIIAQKS